MDDEVKSRLLNSFDGGMKPGADIGYLDNVKSINADSLSAWVESEGTTWRKDSPLGRMILQPALPKY